MKKFKKFSFSLIAILLCVTTLMQTVFAKGIENKTLYIKDLKIIYADNQSEAKKQLPDGYNLVDGNLNDYTDRTGVYLCYSTTEDPDKAITDIKVMHEDGGFERTDFKSTLDNAIDGVYALAEEMTTAVEEFAQNYKDKVPSAIYAKEALDYFKYDDDTLLGDFMISGKGTYKEYGQMILMCHEDILNPILSLLALGVQKKQGENWIDKLANIDPEAYNETHDAKYRERATKLRPILQQFNDVYCYVVGYYDETYTYDDLTEENDKELFADMAENKDALKLIQSILQSYPVGENYGWGEWGGTAEDLFAIGLNNPLNIYESYALLDCLTPGQEIMLRLTGPYNFIIGAQNSVEVLQEAQKRITEELDKNDKVPIWDGVELDMFNQEVGLTNDAIRSISAGRQYDLFTRDVDTLKQHYRNVASIVSSAFAIATSAVMVFKCALPLTSLAFGKAGFATAAAAISAFASSALVVNILFYAGISFLVAGIVCAIIVTFFLEDIINWLLSEDYERTSIPEYMVDEVVNKDGVSTYAYYKRVSNVKSDKDLKLDTDDNESGSDINANKGYRWMAIYTSNKQSVGNPIEANFKFARDDGNAPEGYVNLSMFGKNNAINLNSYADSNSSKFRSIYLFYKQNVTTPVQSEKMYISDLRVESASHEDVVKKELANRGYITYEHNFANSKDEAIFIGYKLTNNPNDAIRDIRLLYNFNGSGITFGQLNYGSMGKIGLFDIMVSTTNANPAPPVVSIKAFKKGEEPDAEFGYEPVNEFSGGMAHALGESEYRLYFLPETTFTEGEDYISGIKTDVYYYNTHTHVVAIDYIMRYYFPEDRYANSVDRYREYKTNEYGENFFDYETQTLYMNGIESNFTTAKNIHSLGYKYTTTKNPYRALYSVSATTLSGLDSFNSNINYGGTGYVLSAVELTTNSYNPYCDFVYTPQQNKHEFAPTTSEAYRSHRSPGKADAYYDTAYYSGRHGTHCRYDIRNQDITQVLLGKNANALYCGGYEADRTPLKANDIIIAQTPLKQDEIPQNFTAVYSMIGSNSEPINVAPTTDNTTIYEESTWGGMSSEDVKFNIYNQAYMYVRNEKTVNGKVTPQNSLKEGKYISGVFVTSREEVREASLKNNPDLKCQNIDKSLVEYSLLSSGATITYNKHINTNYSKNDDFKNANYTYVGISRTDDKNLAIRDIRLYVAQKGEIPKKNIKREISYNNSTFDVTYTLTSRTSLTEQGNKSDKDCAKERQVYVYVSTNPALGEPITDIKMSNWFSYEDFEPVLTTDNKHFITAYNDNKKAGGASIFIDDDYFMHGNHLSFRREGGEHPYVQSIMVAAHDDGDRQAVTKLLEKGYNDIIKKDLNEGAGGDYIYIGMKRTANKKDAIYDIMLTNDKKSPPQTRNGYSLTSKVDLNKDAGGDYIYLYEKRTPYTFGQSPLLDILAKGKSFKDSKITSGTKTSYEVRAKNQKNNVLDVNEDAGGEYIYLVKIYEVDTALAGSILASGSVIVIILFALAALGAGGYISHKKKRLQKSDKQSKNRQRRYLKIM